MIITSRETRKRSSKFIPNQESKILSIYFLSFSAFNPRLKKPNHDIDDDKEDKIDLFGDNPQWEEGWVKAYRINALGQVLDTI